ncbi:MAG: NAD(P)-dependent oxidoreductase [Acidimicrobiales bacterium]
MQLAVLGMGKMGRALAVRLLAGGHQVRVWNRSPGRTGPLVGAGAEEAGDIAAASKDAEAVFTSLSDDRAVSDVLAPDDGPRPGIEAGTLVVECSTISPATTRRLAATYPGRYVASPILGAPQAVEAGQAALAVAGPAEALDHLAPVWETLGGNVRRCGDDPGLASVVKLLSNYLLMAGLVVLSEAAVAGQVAGLDDDVLEDLLGQSPLVAPGLGNRLADLLGGDHRGWFPTPMGAKDVGLFLGIAAAAEVELPVAELVRSRYLQAAEAGWDEADIAAVVELLRAR